MFKHGGSLITNFFVDKTFALLNTIKKYSKIKRQSKILKLQYYLTSLIMSSYLDIFEEANLVAKKLSNDDIFQF